MNTPKIQGLGITPEWSATRGKRPRALYHHRQREPRSRRHHGGGRSLRGGRGGAPLRKLQDTTQNTQQGAPCCSVCEHPDRRGAIAGEAYHVRGRISHGADAPQHTTA
jgi:hypothetical protein